MTIRRKNRQQKAPAALAPASGSRGLAGEVEVLAASSSRSDGRPILMVVD
jgi:hypothetical protein